MENLVFQLKFAGKQFDKEAHRSEKAVAAEKEKCRRAMDKQNMDSARIHAESAIRNQNMAKQYLRLSARMDAVSCRVDAAVKMQKVSAAMGGVVKGMEGVLNSMDPVKIAAAMDKFEKQFETLDVTTAFTDDAIGASMATSTPREEVEALMKEVADINGLDIGDKLSQTPAGAGKLPTTAAPAVRNSCARGIVFMVWFHCSLHVIIRMFSFSFSLFLQLLDHCRKMTSRRDSHV